MWWSYVTWISIIYIHICDSTRYTFIPLYPWWSHIGSDFLLIHSSNSRCSPWFLLLLDTPLVHRSRPTARARRRTRWMKQPASSELIAWAAQKPWRCRLKKWEGRGPPPRIFCLKLFVGLEAARICKKMQKNKWFVWVFGKTLQYEWEFSGL